MIDARMFASIPFRNQTALVDFAGLHFLWHTALARHVADTLNVQYRVLPIGNVGGRPWLEAIQQQYVSASLALGVPPPPDLATYDLNDPVDFASWTWLVSQTAQVLQEAADFR